MIEYTVSVGGEQIEGTILEHGLDDVETAIVNAVLLVQNHAPCAGESASYETDDVEILDYERTED